jgi:hypothetical protein
MPILESAKAKPSLRVKKALVDSGAYKEEDFDDDEEDSPPVNAMAANKPSTVMKQVDQKTYDSLQKSQKAVADAKYLKYKQGGYK